MTFEGNVLLWHDSHHTERKIFPSLIYYLTKYQFSVDNISQLRMLHTCSTVS